MTRLGLLSTFLTAPLLGVAGVKAESQKEDETIIMIGPGNYSVSPSGSILIGKGGRVTIKGVTFEPLLPSSPTSK